jgi:hypothetical protein
MSKDFFNAIYIIRMQIGEIGCSDHVLRYISKEGLMRWTDILEYPFRVSQTDQLQHMFTDQFKQIYSRMDDQSTIPSLIRILTNRTFYANNLKDSSRLYHILYD